MTTLTSTIAPMSPAWARNATAPVSAPLPAAVRDLVASARRSLTEAVIASTPCERYAAAHLAALRAAAAVLAARSRPSGKRRRQVRSVWVVLPEVAFEFTEWAAFFATSARKRSAAEAGVPCVTPREADDLVRDADAFLARVTGTLGLPHQTMLIAGLRHTG
ncbi:MAG: hypothetical protein F2892_00115 [Actinobacteria bacterium]|jgi:hypothetical protein|uniref:Unannotated protein n=1 Tax=freshwater metagenome TaxID=449393 RepID=A0A6J7M165_9ZZZZ|nr:hypothetical protein [Actinomycetota bacterium]MSV73932.1 hypothetical protein [Actinomycetota bacterium]